jgi:anti-anti-sigma regulatory factor
MSDFEFRVVEGSPHRVFLAGVIDFATAPHLAELLCDLSGDIEVDCAEVTFIDTAGFEALDWGYVVATARSHSFAVLALRDFQARVADLLRVPYGRTVRADGQQRTREA